MSANKALQESETDKKRLMKKKMKGKKENNILHDEGSFKIIPPGISKIFFSTKANRIEK